MADYKILDERKKAILNNNGKEQLGTIDGKDIDNALDLVFALKKLNPNAQIKSKTVDGEEKIEINCLPELLNFPSGFDYDHKKGINNANGNDMATNLSTKVELKPLDYEIGTYLDMYYEIRRTNPTVDIKLMTSLKEILNKENLLKWGPNTWDFMPDIVLPKGLEYDKLNLVENFYIEKSMLGDKVICDIPATYGTKKLKMEIKYGNEKEQIKSASKPQKNSSTYDNESKQTTQASPIHKVLEGEENTTYHIEKFTPPKMAPNSGMSSVLLEAQEAKQNALYKEWEMNIQKYNEQITNNTFNKSDIPNLLKTVSSSFLATRVSGSTMKQVELIQSIQNSPEMITIIADHFNCKPEEVHVGNWTVGEENKPSGLKKKIFGMFKQEEPKKKVVVGTVLFSGKPNADHSQFDDVKAIVGNINFEKYNQQSKNANRFDVYGDVEIPKDSIIKDPYLNNVHGSMLIEADSVTNEGLPRTIGGNLEINQKGINNLDNLIIVGNNLDLRESEVVTLGGNLTEVGGNFYSGSKLGDTRSLNHIGGNASFEENISTLYFLKSVGGNLYLRDCKKLDSFNSLKNLEEVGGNFNISGTNIMNLKKLQSVGGDAYVDTNELLEMDKLTKVGGHMYLNDKYKNNIDVSKIDVDNIVLVNHDNLEEEIKTKEEYINSAGASRSL